MGAWAGMEMREVHLGITEHDFVLVETDLLGKPSGLRRTPLNQVKLLESREGLLSDEVVIEIGETKPIRVRVPRRARQETRQLVGILSGHDVQAGQAIITSPSSNREESTLQTPFWKRYLWGAGAVLAGNLMGWLLSGCLVSSLTSNDFVEGYGILAALLCWVVVLPGCLALGALAAWLGPLATRARPERAKKAIALLGFSLGVATWVLIGVLSVTMEGITT
jgi:hypothetical protein